ncbi:MAG TPA: Ig-like domain-containing protein, partial [Candidatus Paceibacterota bacterium]|nr:Ig-like domain-containing protein [Candidatus Paceibacterota bacterium]
MKANLGRLHAGRAIGLAFVCFTSPLYSQLFSDNFTRGTDPGPLSPWIAQSGTWTVTGGAMRAGTNSLMSYGSAYITNSYYNYSVEARLRMPVGAYGGGIAGRLNPATGARYAAWLYPENSGGGSNVVKLVKFQTWTSFGYDGMGSVPMRQVQVGAVGTNWHTLKLTFQGNLIQVFYDGAQVISTNDIEATTYSFGAVGLDLWTDATGYNLFFDDVIVTSGGPPVANNDSYTVSTTGTLVVPDPGVLGNDTGGTGPLRAVLVSGPTRGTLNLSTNGGFTYTPNTGYVGNDSFTYRANDGQTNSPTATVSIAVTPNQAPVANPDSYTVLANTPLIVAAPGVLGNDTDPEGRPLRAVLVAGPASGTLTLSTNGGFTYTPNANYTGTDSFTYRANDGISNSAVATVSISVVFGGTWWLENFARTNEPGTLDPWIAQAGTWTINSGVLYAGTNINQSYGLACVTNLWTNFAAQARFQFPAGAYGGGLGACLNPATGARYSAWIYPEGSFGGSNVLKLVKFQDWTTFGYDGVPSSIMQQVSVPPVGTNWHTIKMAVMGGRIAVYYDGRLALSVSDAEAQPYTSGGISLDMWTATPGYRMAVDDVMVDPLVTRDEYSVDEDTVLTLPAPGVLANDSGVFGTNYSVALVTGPTNGTLILNTNGGFTYTPATNYYGPDSFVYQASDGQTNLGTALVSIQVNEVNDPPVLPTLPNLTIDELTPLVVTNTATDLDVPAQTLTYALISPPAGAQIDSNGVITWTPSEAQGPTNATIRTRVTDSGTPPRSATNSFVVTVNEVNTPPTLPVQPDVELVESATLVVTNAAFDPDLPPNPLSYTLLTAPAGATVTNGIIVWQSAETDGGTTNLFTMVVNDNGVPPYQATNQFTVVVVDDNQAPVLPVQPDRTIAPLTELIITNRATDVDLPADTLVYSLLVGPSNATVSAEGDIFWTPAEEQNNSTNLFVTVVTDSGTPPLSATNSFIVYVNRNPVIVLEGFELVAESCVPTNNRVDPQERVLVSFSLKNTGTGPATNLVVSLLETNGVVAPGGAQPYGVLPAGGPAVSLPFEFTAGGVCGSNVVPVLEFREGETVLGRAEAIFPMGEVATVLTQNFDTVSAPALPEGWTTFASGAQSGWVTQSAVRDTPPQAAYTANATSLGVSALVSPPLVLAVSEPRLSFRHSFNMESSSSGVGYDAGVLELAVGTNGFVDMVAAGGVFLTNGYNRTVSTGYGSALAGRAAWSGNSGGFVTVEVRLPDSAVGQTIQLRWLCATDAGGVSGSGWRVDTIGLSGLACCANSPPVLAGVENQTVAEGATLIVTNTALSLGHPANPLIYQLEAPPLGAAIDTNGVITWTPEEAQGPGTYTLTTIARNSGAPALAATNSFVVVVGEVNTAPVLPGQADVTVAELETLVVTNTASDADLPANGLTYSLVNAPAGASIDAQGVITWTPTEEQGPSTN